MNEPTTQRNTRLLGACAIGVLLFWSAFHTGIAVMQGLISFGLAMSAALVLYLRPIERPFGLPSLTAEEEPAGTYATT